MTEQDKERQRNFLDYDSLSTEALESILRADAQQLDNDDAILYIAEILEKRAAAKHEYTFDTEAKKEEFNQWYLPYLSDGQPLSSEVEDTNGNIIDLQSHPKRAHRKTITLLRCACIVVATVVMLFAVSLAASAMMGTNLWTVIANWTDEVFGFGNVEEHTGMQDAEVTTDAEAEQAFSTLQEALDAYGITEVREPRLPKGYTAFSIEAGPSPVGFRFYAEYTDGASLIFVEFNEFTDMPVTVYEKTNDQVETFQAKNTVFYCFSNTNNNTIAWVTEHYECSIIGQVSTDTLKTIAKSIIE